ncbi:uroporphyrinogen decarboxylase family protein [Chloroflexota bacterium]
MEKNWQDMSADEKREDLIQKWLSPEGTEYASPEAEKLYKERVNRFLDAIRLEKEPDRVPVFPIFGFFPAFYAGYTPQDVMYDYDKLLEAWRKCHVELEPDAHGGAVVSPPGKMFEILDYKLYAWPGHGVAPQHSYQYIEGEYMMADEYNALIQDPTLFFLTTYYPRIFGTLGPLAAFPTVTSNLEMYGGFSAVNFIPFGLPDVQEAFQKLFEAGAETLKWIQSVGAFGAMMNAAGIPGFFGGGCKVPFDVIGDTLRGSRGIMVDMYRQPAKLIEALEAMTPLAIKMGASAAIGNGNPLVFIPLHKGADGFLSDEQFRKFYWPTFKKLLLGLIDEGCIPFPYAEGGYNTRLDVIKDVPKGKVIWGFDLTDMAKAKKVLGDVCCIGGNMPIDVLTVGSPQQVKDKVKGLIDTCSKDGGYIMMSGAVIEDVPTENIRAMIEVTKEYGVYK